MDLDSIHKEELVEGSTKHIFQYTERLQTLTLIQFLGTNEWI